MPHAGPFLTAAQKQRRKDFSRGLMYKAPRPFGAVDFVGGHTNEVRPQTFCLEGDFQEALDRIRMENGLRADRWTSFAI